MYPENYTGILKNHNSHFPDTSELTSCYSWYPFHSPFVLDCCVLL